MENIKLYRKRLIPDECKLLKDDTILYMDDKILVTKWTTIRPKKVLHHGLSCYFLDKGYKLSKFYDKDNNFICWYCDIIEYEYEEATSTYTFIDLLADVIVYPDDSMRVVDLDELAEAFEKRLIDERQLKLSLRNLDRLLRAIYTGKFKKLIEHIETRE